jgi:hypothetical protein
MREDQAGGSDESSPKKHGWRHFKPLAEFFYVLLVELPFAMQDLRDDAL